MSVNGGSTTVHKAGDKIALAPSSYAVVESSGKLPLLILGGGASSSVKVKLKSIEGGAPGLEANQTLNDIVLSINRIQVMISKGETKEALLESETLEKKYPTVAIFSYLKANALLLLGEIRSARSTVERALAAYPNSPEGKLLYQKILEKGGR